MRKKNLKSRLFWVLMLGSLMASHPVFAEENVQELKRQIEELKAKVAELERHQNTAFPEPRFPAMPAPTRWNPSVEMEHMNNEIAQMFHHALSQSFSPAGGMFSNHLFFDNSQIKELKDGYSIRLNIAGLDNDKININVNNHSLNISGQYKGEERKQNQKIIWESHNYGKFLNIIPLPQNADVSKMKTEKKGNHLEIFLPKKV